MPDILQLEDFYVTRLSATWHAPEPPSEGQVQFESKYTIDYDVLRRKDDARLFALRFRFRLESHKEGKAAGYDIDSEIMGLFRFPESMTEDEMQRLVRVNGSVILYGVLRGEVAAFTGSFPGSKCILPAVYMPEIVERIENQKKVAVATRPAKAAAKGKRKTKSS
ncbi:MAG TPA: hypothetical protein PLD73_12270 [Candidatus Hydrogenedentes bacterium]|nr:hypothetical protein [Candidatus Hydrogenedentota bacterium]